MRKAFRFKPDPLDYALIDFQNQKDKFNPTAVAIIHDESYTGCSLIFKSDSPVAAGATVQVKVGKLDVVPAKVVWVKEIDKSLYQIGVQFLV